MNPTLWTRFHWDCPDCDTDNVIDVEEADLVCDGCGAKFEAGETR